MVNRKIKVKKEKIINLPMTKKDAMNLKAGDNVLITGTIVTGRDKVHKFLCSKKSQGKNIPINLEGTVLYHCGPIVKKIDGGYKIIAAGPTTSIRMEMYEHEVISRYKIHGVMGKGGMGKKTLDAMRRNGCVYFHAIGGAAAYLADRIRKVADVWKLDEFGAPEAMWILEVEKFPAIVTMDAHGKSVHEKVEKESNSEFRRLVR